MNDIDRNMRGVPPMDFDTAVDEAVREALTMLRFIEKAHDEFGDQIGANVLAAFDEPLWEIAGEYADRITNAADLTGDVYQALINAKLPEEPQE